MCQKYKSSSHQLESQVEDISRKEKKRQRKKIKERKDKENKGKHKKIRGLVQKVTSGGQLFQKDKAENNRRSLSKI